MTVISPLRLSSEVSPLRHVWDITARAQGKDITAYETYRALPSPSQPYSPYDYAVVAEVLRAAEASVAKAHKKGQGSGIVTLQSVLQAYEAVLPRHGVKPDEDTYYYRLLLKLSLDPHLDWWAKLNRETGTIGGRSAFHGANASDASSGRHNSPYRTSPTRAGASSALSTDPTVRSSVPSNGGARVPGRTSPYRSTASLARMSGHAAQAAAREAAVRAAAAAASANAAVEAARRAAEGGRQLPSSRFVFNTPPLTPAFPGMGSFPPASQAEGGASGGTGSGWESPYGASSAGAAAGSMLPYGNGSDGGAASQYGPGSSRYGPGSPYGGISEHDALSPEQLQQQQYGRGAELYGAAGTPGSRGRSSGGGGLGMGVGDGSAAGYGGADGRGMGDDGAAGYGGAGGRGSGGGGTHTGTADEPGLSEEAEAYLDFNRMARAFRTWRRNTFARRTSRYERDQALRNWAVATSFWAVQLLRRCFSRWRGVGPRKAARALGLWAGNSRAGCFWRWLQLTRYLRDKGEEGDHHWRGRLLRSAWRRWRAFAVQQRRKALALDKALGFWAGRSLRGCWRTWRAFTGNQLRKTIATARALDFWSGRSLRGSFLLWRLAVERAHSNWDRSTQYLLRHMILKWRLVTMASARLAAAQHSVVAAEQQRLLASAMQALLQAHAFRHDSSNRLRAAVARMRNAVLSRAFNKWAEARQAAACKRERVQMALRWWSVRGVSRSWNTWREAVASARRALQAARNNAQRILRPLLRDCFYAWLDWHDVKMERRAHSGDARGTMESRRTRLVVLAWRGLVLERRHSAVAFQLIMRSEVQRLMGGAFRRWYREHDNLRRAAEARLIVRRGAAKRCLRHWKALAVAQREHLEWRLQRLCMAASQRKRRLLAGWQVVAGLLAEHGRLVRASLIKLHRRQAGWVLRVWRDRVLHSVAGRMKLLAALMLWERAMTARAWLGWQRRLYGWRSKAGRWALAARHHRTRRLALSFAVLLSLWQAYQGRLTRALLYRSVRNDVRKGQVVDAWRRLVGWLQWKNDKARRAMAHDRCKRLGGGLYGWYAVTRHAMATRRAVAGAVMHWVRRRRGAAFLWWRNWAAHRRDLSVRGAGYALVRAVRAKERALLALKANVIRKARIAGATAHRRRYAAHLALSGWLLRTLLAADWVRKLRGVGVQLSRQLMADGLAAWCDFTHYRRTKRGMLHASLRYWRLGRLRAALDGLRWNATRRQLQRAVLLRGQMGGMSRALRAWRDEADYRRRLRDRYAILTAGNRRAALKRGLDLWRHYLEHRTGRKGLRDRALRHWLRGTAGKVFRSWRGYHDHLRRAEERAGDITRRWRRRDAAEALAAFAEYAAHRRRKRGADDLFRRSRTRTALAAWRDHIKTKTAVGFWSRNRLNDAIEAWRRHAQRSRSLRDIGGRVAARWRQLQAASALGSWRHYADTRRRLTQLGGLLASHTRRGALAASLRSWRTAAAYRARLRAASSAVTRRLRRGTLGGVFGAWRAEARHMGALKGLLERVLVRSSALAFFGWREVAAEAKRWRAVQAATQERMRQRPQLGEVASYAAARMRQWPLSVAFYSWYDNTQEARYLRSRATQAILSYATGLLHRAWSTWLAHTLRRRHLRAKLGRFLAAAGAKTARTVFSEWMTTARYLGRLRRCSDLVKERLLSGTLRGAFTCWRSTAVQWLRLKGILARVMSRQLAAAWEGWRWSVADKAERLQVVWGIYARWLHRHMASAFNAWCGLVARRAVARRLAARCFGRLLDWAWQGWREAVFAAGVARGGAIHTERLLWRVWQGWRGVVEGAARAAELRAQLDQALALKAMGEWRRQWLGRAAFRRLYGRRALLGWHERTQELRAARARLWHAARFILHGSLVRSFSSWWQYTQAMAIKRTVFFRKQRALAEALRRGGELAARRNSELAEVAFRAWHLQTGLLKQVSRRLRVLRERIVALAFVEWREYASVKRARLEKQASVIRHRLLSRPLRAWRAAAVGASAATAAKSAAAMLQRSGVLISSAFSAWRSLHRTVGERREGLRRALAAAGAARASGLKAHAWASWRRAVSRRADVMSLVDMVSHGRRMRVLGEAFDVWLKYTQAMRDGGIDPGSPYLSPRARGTERRLVTRMAALAGNDQALAGSSHSGAAATAASASAVSALLEGLYPSAALQQAAERRQELTEFLAFARRATSAGRSGRGRERRGVERAGSVSSGGGGSRASTGFSSGAGGADLAQRAVLAVRATPGLISPGKGRGPASGLTPAHLHYATSSAAQRGGVSMGWQAAGNTVDLAASPFDDRLDLRALYDNSNTAVPAAVQFGGFTATGRQQQPAASPRPLQSRAPTPLTVSAPIAPRRIDFTAPRPGLPPVVAGGSVQRQRPGSDPYGHAYYAYEYGAAATLQRPPAYGDVGAWSDDTASTTSSDFLAPSEARARAAVAAGAGSARAGPPSGGAFGSAAGLSRRNSATLGWSPAAAGGAPDSYTGPAGGGATVGGGRAGGAVFMGGPLAWQPGSILDRRRAGR